MITHIEHPKADDTPEEFADYLRREADDYDYQGYEVMAADLIEAARRIELADAELELANDKLERIKLRMADALASGGI